MSESPADPLLLCYCACPDQDSANRIAWALVTERLAACVSRLGGMASVYRWEGAVVSASEELLLIKTSAARFEAMKARVLALHPYEVPELLAVPVSASHAAYAVWLRLQLD